MENEELRSGIVKSLNGWPSQVFSLLVIFTLPAAVPATEICENEFKNNIVDVRMQTDLGGIDIQVRGDVAPNTAANFCEYMIIGAYDGTFIHRNLPGFVVQGGGSRFNPDDGPFFGGGVSPLIDPLFDPVMNEAGLPGALLNVRRTMAMAKTDDPDSATSQWFFNLVDNPGLDNPANSGGFTVFAVVQDYDMDIVDDISAQDVCKDIIGLGFICGSTYSDTIIVDAAKSTVFDPGRLLLVNNVGIDSDGDGIIDRVEDTAPNGGDNNNDTFTDSTQNNVASFSAGTDGQYISIEVPESISLQSVDVLGRIFSLAHPPEVICELIGFEFKHNYFGFTLENVPVGGSTSVEITLPADELPDIYFNYGPTQDNAEPHYYEFMFDDETGAVIVDNVVTLHFVDGKRGDSDLNATNGVIASIGGPARRLDSLVTEFTDLNGDNLTIETDADIALEIINSNFQGLPQPEGDILNGKNFSHGFINFEFDLCTGTTTIVKMVLPAGEKPDSYFMLGPTPDNPEPHYYEFLFDDETGTGAVIDGNVIMLHFVDGKRGDADLDDANGTIPVLGGPAFNAPNSASGGGGCSIAHNRKATGPRVDHMLLLLFVAFLWAGRKLQYYPSPVTGFLSPRKK